MSNVVGCFVASCDCGAAWVRPLSAEDFRKAMMCEREAIDGMAPELRRLFDDWVETHQNISGGKVSFKIVRLTDIEAVETNEQELRTMIAGFYVLQCSCGDKESIALGPTALAEVTADLHNIARFVSESRNAELDAFYQLHMKTGIVGKRLLRLGEARVQQNKPNKQSMN